MKARSFLSLSLFLSLSFFFSCEKMVKDTLDYYLCIFRILNIAVLYIFLNNISDIVFFNIKSWKYSQNILLNFYRFSYEHINMWIKSLLILIKHLFLCSILFLTFHKCFFWNRTFAFWLKKKVNTPFENLLFHPCTMF